MKRLNSLIQIFGMALWILTLLFQTPAASQTVEEFEEALTPQTSGTETRTRGLGGVQPKSSAPQKAMHLTFQLDSAILMEPAKSTLNQLGQALQKEKLQGYIFRLEGHTCDLGSDSHNMALSKERTIAVQRYLTDNFGLSRDQIQATWFGESQPVVPNIDEAAREKNRRVVIINTLESLTQAESAKGNALQIRRLKEGRESLIADGEKMSQNDSYAVEFKTAAERYVYIYQKDGSGKLTPIFPNAQVMTLTNPLQSNAFYRMPGPDKWFFLDESKGTEEILMLASESPLQDPVAAIRTIVTNNMYASNTRGLGGINRKESSVAASKPSASAGYSKALAEAHTTQPIAQSLPKIGPNSGGKPEMRVVRRYFIHE